MVHLSRGLPQDLVLMAQSSQLLLIQLSLSFNIGWELYVTSFLHLGFDTELKAQLGFMSPNGNTNLAVKDLVNAMQFLRRVSPAFGGTTSKITLAGQSSGANMIRALLATPSASALFKSAILQSDPMVRWSNFFFL